MGGSFDKDLLNYVSILNNRVASFEFSNRASTRQYVTNQDTLEDREKFRLKQSFIDLNSRLIKAQFQARACDSRWKNLIKDCIRYEVHSQYLHYVYIHTVFTASCRLLTILVYSQE